MFYGWNEHPYAWCTSFSLARLSCCFIAAGRRVAPKFRNSGEQGKKDPTLDSSIPKQSKSTSTTRARQSMRCSPRSLGINFTQARADSVPRDDFLEAGVHLEEGGGQGGAGVSFGCFAWFLEG